MEEILSRRFNRTVRVVGAGRTDAGVHARGQAFHFDLFLDETTDLVQLQNSINSMARQDMRVWNISKAPPARLVQSWNGTGVLVPYEWHAIYNATQKLYSYRISTGSVMNPLLRHRRWHIDYSLDMAELSRILSCFKGTRDFRAFAGAIEKSEKRRGKPVSTIRTVYKVELVDEGGGNYRIDILLRGALYKMVRNMVATAVEVCKEKKGRIDKDTFLELLYQGKNGVENVEEENQKIFARDNNPCEPAPPHGLTLERVYFGDDF